MSKIKRIEYSEEKNKILKEHRQVSFEDVEKILIKNEVIDILQNNDPYSHQRMFIVKINGYLCRVPFVEDDDKIFLKTIIPDRKLKKYYE